MKHLLVIGSLIGLSLGTSAIAQDSSAANAQDSRSQSVLADSIDRYAEDHMKSEQIPGLAVVVLKNGDIIHAKGYGFANLEHQVPVTTQTVFQSGSVGKAFTVIAVMMLVDEGKVRLDDNLSVWFPDAPEAWSSITVQHLLEHTSGLRGYPDDFDFRVDRSEAELYEIIKAQPLAFAAGERRSYSNLGFVLLGILINKVSGKHHGDFLQERIFTPLHMTSARIISEAEIVPNRASGYRLIDSKLANHEWVAPSLNTTADGALYLSVEDIAKWEAALHRGDLLSPQSYDKMWTRLTTTSGVQEPWGFSWLLADVNGQRFIEHSGGWQGFTANFSRYPAKGLAVAVLQNRRGANPVEPARRILEILEPELSIAGAPVLPEVEPAVVELGSGPINRIHSATRM